MNNKMQILISTFFILGCIAYSWLLYPTMRQSSQNFVEERSVDSLKIFATLSLVKGTIELAKKIPAIGVLASRAKPVEDIVDILWNFSMYSYIFNKILDIYVSTDSIFTVSILGIIIYHLFIIIYQFMQIVFSRQQGKISILSALPVCQFVYRTALLFALILPLYILLSMNFYEWFDTKYIEPEYNAIAAMFSDVEAIEKKIQGREQQEFQLEENLQFSIQNKKLELEEITNKLNALIPKIDSFSSERWFFQGKSPEEQELRALYDAVEQQADKVKQDIESDEQTLAASQGKGLDGVWNTVKDYVTRGVDYSVAYTKAFIRLMGRAGRENLQNYTFNSISLFVMYFAILPIALLLFIRSLFQHSEQQELKRLLSQLVSKNTGAAPPLASNKLEDKPPE